MAYTVRHELLTDRERLERELDLERELERRRLADPLAAMSWLPAQLALLKSTRKRKLLRAGSQSTGKTTAGTAEVIYRAAGKHPFKVVPRGPTWQWCVGATEKHTQILQAKFHELCPPELIHPDSPEFDPNKGHYGGRNPRVTFTNGSWIEWRTGGGDPLNMASQRLHHILCDEPLENERVYNELQKRLLRTNGDLTLTFTPVNRPVGWVKEKAEKGLIEDLHFDLRPEHMVFAHGPRAGQRITLDDGTPCDAEWIRSIIAETSDMEVPVTVHGGYEFRHGGAYFEKVWDPARMILAKPPRPRETEYEWVLGLDWGSRPGKMIGILMAIDEHNGGSGFPYIHVVDCYVGTTGRETPDDDARGVITLLARNGLSWGDLKFAGSDATHRAGRGDQKSGPDFQAALAKRLGLAYNQVTPMVRVIKRGKGRGAGSVGTRSSWLHKQMSRYNFSVAPKVKPLVDAIPRYLGPFGSDADDNRDPVDAVVYGLDRYIYGSNPRVGRLVLPW